MKTLHKGPFTKDVRGEGGRGVAEIRTNLDIETLYGMFCLLKILLIIVSSILIIQKIYQMCFKED